MFNSVKLPLTRHENIYATLIYITGPLVSILDVLTIWSSASISLLFLDSSNKSQSYEFLGISSLNKRSVLAIFLAFFLLRTFVRLIRIRFEANLRRILAERVTKRVFEAQIAKHSQDKNNVDSSEMLRDIGSIPEFLNCFIFSRFVIFEESLLIVGTTLAISVNSTMGGISVLVFGGLLLCLAVQVSYKKIKQAGYDFSISQGRRVQFSLFTYRSVKELIAYGKNKSAVKFFAMQLKDSLRAEQRFHVISQSSSLAIEAIIVISVVLALWITSVVSVDGTRNLSGAVILALSAFRIIPCIARLNFAFQSRRYAEYQSGILMRYLTDSSISNDSNDIVNARLPAIDKIESSSEKLKDFIGVSVELKNVTFAYSPNGPQVITNLSHEFQTGLLHVIRGESGRGKSTLLNLIMGFADLQDGQILINQIPLRSSQIFRGHQIAYMPQSPTTLDYSLSSNITLAFLDNEEVDESRLRSAVVASGLEKFIESLPDGLSTTLGEFGSRVSGGQIQRIALARALYRKSRVLLLDEATSSLDYETEAKILKDLADLKDQTLIILVSHSSHVAQYADKILEL